MNSLPLACDMNVFTPVERERHLQTTLQLFKTTLGFREALNGFEFDFPATAETFTKLAEFIANERLCCPFLEFTLKVMPESQLVTLILAGPEGAQEFLRAEFSEAFI